MAYSYASAPDVLGHLPFVGTIFGGTSGVGKSPNATQVHQQLLDTARELDGALAVRNYSVPVSTAASQSMDLLKGWNGIGAAVFTAAGLPHGSDGKHVAFLERRWDSILRGIRDGELQLPDADRDTTLGRARYTGNPTAAFAASHAV